MRETLLYLCEKFEVAFSLKQEDYGSLRALKQRSRNLLQLISGMSRRTLHRQLEVAENEDDSFGSDFPAGTTPNGAGADESTGLSLVPALLSPDRPTKRILTFIDGNFDALFEYHRKYKFSFIPNGTFRPLSLFSCNFYTRYDYAFAYSRFASRGRDARTMGARYACNGLRR